jgi:gliding motility-associated-like protein
MKTIKRLLCAAILFFTVQTSFAQKWLWVNAAANNDTSTRCVPWANATDTAGNVFVTGGYTGATTFGTFPINSMFGKPFAAFLLVKYSAAGNVLWARTSVTKPPYSWCFAFSIATDKAGDAYATGTFYDSVSFGALTISNPSPNPNMFLVKYDPSGNVLWIRTPAPHSSQCSAQGNFVAVDPNGNPYVTGVFNDTVSFGANTLTNGSNNGNAFIVKYDPNGNPIWAKSPACISCAALGSGIASDNAGNIYETGNYNTATAISFGAFNLGNGLSRNMFLTKYDGNGNVLWATNASLPSTASAISKIAGLGEYVTTDAANNAYVLGNYIDTATFGTHTISDGINSTYGNIFVAKYSAAGNNIWAKSGTIPNTISFATDYSVTSDRWNNIYVSGTFNTSLTFGGINLTAPANTQPSFIIKLDSAGNALCGSSVNNQRNTSIAVDVSAGTGVTADPKGPNVYFTGNIQGFNQCLFGTDTVNGIGEIIGITGKWTCGTCNVAPNLTGLTSVCNGQTITLVAGGGLNYVWSTGNTGDSLTFSPSVSKYYYVAISNDSCTRNDSIDITIHPVPTPTISNAQTICEGSTARLSASGGLAYSWSPVTGLNSGTVANPNASPATTTNYTVTISNGFCNATDSTTIYVNPYPAIAACCDTSIAPGQSVQLNSSGGGTYSWQTSSGLSCNNCPNPVASPLVSTTYTLTITSDSGCSVARTITIDVNCGEVFIPEAFSPNGDGKNDVLYVRGDCIKTLSFMIFDRWGNRIFETTDKYIGWNGEYKGQATNTGSYVYYISATNYDGTSFTKKGNVELVR